MCGIAGTMGTRWSERDFLQLFRAIRHRGPDASGVASIGPARLGMHRLHLRGEPQELPVRVGSSLAGFNGQVYGRRFVDGGVEDIDASLPNEIAAVLDGVADGMFAAALVEDQGAQIQLLNDDDFIKPLFYVHKGMDLAFCSEFAPLASLLAGSAVNRRALAELFAYGWYLGADSWLDGIRLLNQGSVLFKDGRAQQSRCRLQSEAVAPKELRALLRQSVSRCVQGDGPFGLALSGGLDSTVLAWELNAIGVENLTTVSLRLPDSDDGVVDLSEIGLPEGGAWRSWRHILVDLSSSDFLRAFRTSAVSFGHPTTMSSLPLTWSLAEAAAEAGIRVMLSGEGVDELFCGYGSYAKVLGLPTLLAYYRHKPREALVEILLGREGMKSVRKRFARRFAETTDLRSIERRIRLSRLLLRTDVCFMTHSIEARVPFMHNGIPELALAQPYESLLRQGGKAPVRDAWRSDLGGAAVAKSKVRFKASNRLLRHTIAGTAMRSKILDTAGSIFGADQLRKCFDRLLLASDFDADIASLLMSLTFILGEAQSN